MSDPQGGPMHGSEPAPRRRLRDRIRPGEVLGLSAVLAAFVGVGVLISTRSLVLAVEFAGAAFIVSVVVCAMLLLAISKPGVTDGSDDVPSGH